MAASFATLWTIGHSNRDLADFLALLRGGEIELVADVRRFPSSRRHPHFAGKRLSAELERIGIGYVHIPELGGHREPRPSSPHAGLPPGPFRGYADHMETPEFAGALERLRALSSARRTCAMCAEARWQDCHRRLLSDRWVAEGGSVLHLAPGAAEPHVLHAAVRVVDGRLIYVGRAQRGLFE